MSLTRATITGTTTATVTTATNKQPQQCYLNQNQNCGNEELDETNSKPHLSFPLLLQTLFFGDKSGQVKLINFIRYEQTCFASH